LLSVSDLFGLEHQQVSAGGLALEACEISGDGGQAVEFQDGHQVDAGLARRGGDDAVADGSGCQAGDFFGERNMRFDVVPVEFAFILRGFVENDKFSHCFPPFFV
jgi:hypothetical protein